MAPDGLTHDIINKVFERTKNDISHDFKVSGAFCYARLVFVVFFTDVLIIYSLHCKHCIVSQVFRRVFSRLFSAHAFSVGRHRSKRIFWYRLLFRGSHVAHSISLYQIGNL